MPSASATAKDIFLQAVEFTSLAAREDFVQQACNGDTDVIRRVDALLNAYVSPEKFVSTRPVNEGHSSLPAYSALQAGKIIARRYKLLEQLGEGGMGTVWVAEQTAPVKRRVALKLIKPGMDSRQVLSRFEAERQALALMEHPNIAKVYDGGVTEEGRPYFVMEYVKGVPITTYCDDARLSIQERLELFVPICRAVQHAHQKGIIHRDLKPSNLLVCLYDGEPIPKVIDFGLAKAMYQPLTEHTIYTAHGTMVGTPTYMSPEQAEFNNLDVDTRSDVYSLGVILYELLTGTTPIELRRFKEAAWHEILRLIKEEEAIRPSVKLSSSANLPSVAFHRCLGPSQLSRKMQGDLDWIVMKALEKQRSRRYETADALARDVERHLSDVPVEASPPSTAYRAQKLLRRNKGLVLVAVVSLGALLGATGTVWGVLRSEQWKQAEAQQRDRAVKAELALTKAGLPIESPRESLQALTQAGLPIESPRVEVGHSGSAPVLPARVSDEFSTAASKSATESFRIIILLIVIPICAFLALIVGGFVRVGYLRSQQERRRPDTWRGTFANKK